MKKAQKPLEKWEKEALLLLENFRFSPRTNLNDRRISNHDAACFLLVNCGTLAVNRLTHLLRIWRAQSVVKTIANTIRAANPKQCPVLQLQVKHAQEAMKLQFTYLFSTSDQSGYGFVGRDFESTHNEVKYYSYGGPPEIVKRKTYWYRCEPGFYAYTKCGWIRGIQLLDQMKGVLNVA